MDLVPPDGADWVLVRRDKFEAFRKWTAAHPPVCDSKGDDDARLWPPAEILRAIEQGVHPVRAWREFCGLTQAELAERVGLQRLTIRYMELGIVPGRPPTIAKIAQALGSCPRMSPTPSSDEQRGGDPEPAKPEYGG